jgi:large subunit ribosomal protein L24
MKSIKPRKQRKYMHNAPLHKKRKWISSHLAENLLLKYDKRSMPLITGDTVKVMRGSFKGHEDKVAKVHIKKQVVNVEGITTTKADGTKIARPIHASNLLVTKLKLTDKWRREKLEKGLSETTKKEIEKEAEQQLREQQKLEEDKRKEEEQRKLEEESAEKQQQDANKAEIETETEAVPEKPKDSKSDKVDKVDKEKTSPKKEEKKQKPEQKKSDDKPSAPKKQTKKPSVKSEEKKEGDKK